VRRHARKVVEGDKRRRGVEILNAIFQTHQSLDLYREPCITNAPPSRLPQRESWSCPTSRRWDMQSRFGLTSVPCTTLLSRLHRMFTPWVNDGSQVRSSRTSTIQSLVAAYATSDQQSLSCIVCMCYQWVSSTSITIVMIEQQRKQATSAKHDKDDVPAQSFPGLGRASTLSCSKT
jgi:hypothetical protein